MKRNTIIAIGVAVVLVVALSVSLRTPTRRGLAKVETGFDELSAKVARLEVGIEALNEQIARVEEQFDSALSF